MKLYYSAGTCSLALHILMRESGTAFTLEKVDTDRHITASGTDYFTINPKGQVPLLELADGTRMTEGPVIAQYIADRAGATSLMPAPGTLARYRVMEWQNYVTAELHKSFSPLFHSGLDVAAKATLAGLLRRKLRWVNTQLEGTAFLTGAEFTAADAYLFAVLPWTKSVQIDISELENLQAFMRRVAARPAVREAMRVEGLPA